jgi:hypothetical protein
MRPLVHIGLEDLIVQLLREEHGIIFMRENKKRVEYDSTRTLLGTATVDRGHAATAIAS